MPGLASKIMYAVLDFMLPWWPSAKRICLPMQEMQVRFLGTEDPLEEEMAACSSIRTWEIPWTEEPGRATVRGVTKSWTQLSMRAYRPWFYREES